jgi:hypothetical protein
MKKSAEEAAFAGAGQGISEAHPPLSLGIRTGQKWIFFNIMAEAPR